MVAPSGEGALRCMQQAMSTVEGSIDYLNTHGTSTPVGDVAEIKAVRNMFGDKIPTISRSEAHTSELQSLMRISYAVFCLKKKHHTSLKTNIQLNSRTN